jgi:putative FmdB family regulatory protein
MPTYEYKCKQCGNLFELFQPMSAEPVKVCPKCNGEVVRLIGPGAGPIFKGNGFYQTDYKNPPKKDKQKESPKKDNPEAKKTPDGKKS